MTDPELITACLKNDKQAWDALVLRYNRLIYSTALKYGLAPEDASDAFQSVCITLLQQLSTLQDQTKLGPWLVTLTRRKCYKLKKLHNHNLTSLEQVQENVENAPDMATQPPEDEVLLFERQHMIRQAVETLGEKCQKLIQHLYYYDKEPLSHKQIAELLSVSTASIGRMRERCLNKLRNILVELGFK
jgi:RNA polymerase sigma factor (sigma-70 family)